MTADIPVPPDDSPLVESALELEVAIAQLTTGHLTLLEAAPTSQALEQYRVPSTEYRVAGEQSEGVSAATRDYRDYLDKIKSRLEQVGLGAFIGAGGGGSSPPPTAALATHAEENPAVWLVVLTARHPMRPRVWTVGAIVEKVLRAVTRPVLLIRPATEETGQMTHNKQTLKTIVVPLDGSVFAEKSLEEARRLAHLTGASVALVSVVPPSSGSSGDMDQEFVPTSMNMARDYQITRMTAYLARMAEGLQSQGVSVHTELVYGSPAEMILLAARRLQADMIVMAAHGRRELERLWLGSIAQKLVQTSPLPLLLVREPDPPPLAIMLQPSHVADS